MVMTPGELGVRIEDQYKAKLLAKAMEGDMVLELSPSTGGPEATAEAWTQTITATLKTASGAVHTWYNGTQTSKATAGDVSSAGTASTTIANLVFAAGVAPLNLKGDAAAWLEGDTATLTVAELSILGYAITGKTCVLTFVAAE